MVRFDFAEYALILKRYMIHKNALELIGALYDSIVVPLKDRIKENQLKSRLVGLVN